MSEPLTDKAESIRHRLRNRIRERGEDVQFGLQRYAIERFLYRLGVSAHHERFVLKGAALFALWGGSVYRPTRDLDFAGYGSADEADVLAALREVCVLPNAADELVFDPNTLSAEPIRDDSEYNGLRIRLTSTLGTSRIPIQIDIGFGNAIEPPPQYADYPTLLDDSSPRIRTYPPEAVIAEKLHAMVVLGERNSRYKDFYDLHVLARQFRFDGKTLARAIAATFERRRTTIDAALPISLTPRFFADEARAQQWRAYVTRNSLPAAPADFDSVGELIRQFLGPVWSALAEKTTFLSIWRPGGAWNSENIENRIFASSSPASPSSHKQRYSCDKETVLVEDIEIPTATPVRRFKAYPAYRDSGLEWLGEIPTHWEVKRLKHLAKLNPESLREDVDPGMEMVYVDIGGVDSLGRIVEREALTFETAPSRARRIVRDGDVIVSTVRTYLRAIAQIQEPDPGTIVSTGFAVVRPDEGLTTGYAAYALRAPYFVERVVANSKGVSFPAINESEMATYEIARPPAEEQRAIAAFLDRETAKLDALVAKKERLIELLQEKRAALITRTVTKGLDPNVPMKDSGVEWLGEIPEHWEIKQFRHATRINQGLQMAQSARFSEPGSNRFEYITIKSVHAGDQGSKEYIENPPRSVICYPEDILLARTGATGEVISGQLGVFHNNFFKVGFDSNQVNRKYLVYYLTNSLIKEHLLLLAGTTTIPDLNHGEFLATPFVVAPVDEQEKIVSFLESETRKIDSLIAKVRAGVERLQEFRTALISAAVTGKIDVRDVGARGNVPLQNDGSLSTGGADE